MRRLAVVASARPRSRGSGSSRARGRVRAVEDRMVRAAVAERQLERLVAGRRGRAAGGRGRSRAPASRPSSSRDRRHLGDERLRVARAVREQHAVEARRARRRRRVREDGHARRPRPRAGAGSSASCRSRRRATRDVARVAVDVRLRGRDAGDERAALHRRLRAHVRERLLARSVPSATTTRPHRAAVAQAQHERARVDARRAPRCPARAASPPTPARAPRA